MLVCEHEKNIEKLIQEFGNSCSKKEIRIWYNLKRNEVENDENNLPYTSHVVTYDILRKDLDFSFPDNISQKDIEDSNKSYKNNINL